MIIRINKNTNLNEIQDIIKNIDIKEENENKIFGTIIIEEEIVEDKESIIDEEENCISIIENNEEVEVINEADEEENNIEILDENIFYTQEEAIEHLENKLSSLKIENEEKDVIDEGKVYIVKCIIKEEINILKKEIEAKNKFNLIAEEIGVVKDIRFNIDQENGFFPQNSKFMQEILERFKKQTSKSRTCDNCNSVLNKDYIKTTYCPLCESKTFLTTKTDIERAKTMKKKILNFQKEIHTIISKRESKSNLENWEYLTIK